MFNNLKRRSNVEHANQVASSQLLPLNFIRKWKFHLQQK